MNPGDKILLKLTGDFLREKRKQIGYNSCGVARAINTSQSVISYIEQGKYDGLKFQTLNSILKFLDSSIVELDDYIKKNSGKVDNEY